MKICDCREYDAEELVELGKKAVLWDALQETEEAANKGLWYRTVDGAATRRRGDRRKKELNDETIDDSEGWEWIPDEAKTAVRT